MRRVTPGLLVAVAIFSHAGAASAGGIKWVKGKWACKDRFHPTAPALKGTYSAPKGWVRADDDQEPPCPRTIRLQAADGTAHVHFSTVRARVSVEERARWHIQNAVVTTKGGWTCGEGIALDWNGNPQSPAQRVVRCAKELSGGGVIVAALVAGEALFAQLGGQKALRTAVKAVTGLQVPLEDES
jgi:hypothetical protein